MEDTRRLILIRAGNLVVRAEPSLDRPYRATFGRWPPRIREDGPDVAIEYPRLLGAWARRDQNTVGLDASVLWQIEARGTLREVTVDFSAGTLAGFEGEAGVGVTLSLPPPSGRVQIRFGSGVNQVTIHRPAGTEIGLHVRRGAARLRLDDQTFRAIGGETTLRSPGFDAASARYELEVLGGANGLTIDAVAATRPVGRVGRALATVLFTDIVGSTDRARELGDARWGEVLDRHDAAAHASVDGRGGRILKSTGDGILATFDAPGPAIEAARALRAAVADLGLQIRAGLHTGEVEYRGTDVGGIAVHAASRILDAASPGEILVSRTVRDLVAGREVRLEDRGTHTLRGVGDGWTLYAVSD
ncbi:MAG TPA: adenylate/guanylate cyclase domain-containing protein [Actinomycetota bacterium]|nr:adenylate/guanylate cyclase domain-containing protein [Actinomycetota bacterium]